MLMVAVPTRNSAAPQFKAVAANKLDSQSEAEARRVVLTRDPKELPRSKFGRTVSEGRLSPRGGGSISDFGSCGLGLSASSFIVFVMLSLAD
jgi:hypothetical protein